MSIIIISCSNGGHINGFYYDSESSNIYYFEDEKFILYDLIDSTKTTKKYKINDDRLKIDNDNFQILTVDDTLVIYDKNRDRKLHLLKFDFDNFENDLIDSTYWSTVLQKYNPVDKNKYTEDFFLTINLNNGMDSYYSNNHDTIYWQHFDYKNIYFNKFPLFKESYMTAVVLRHDSNDLHILIYDGFVTETYIFKRIKNSAWHNL